MKRYLPADPGIFTPEQVAEMQAKFNAQSVPGETPDERAQRARKIIASELLRDVAVPVSAR